MFFPPRPGSCSRLFFVLCFVSAALAQPPLRADLVIEVKDPSGAGMQASVSLSRPGGEVVRKATTDRRGSLTLKDLEPGDYRIDVAEPGFVSQNAALSLRGPGPVKQSITLPLRAQSTRIQVVSSTPLPEADIPLQDLARPAQTAGKLDLIESGSINLADLLAKRLTSVYSTETQGNPFQPDINYRGYTASPLLGTPQGLSVFLDGVRMNQPFGDVVSWDLIPKAAIAEVELIPGSDPLFGLNTLGGALAVRTKEGASNPGTNLDLGGGSFGRKTLEAERGGLLRPNLSYFAATNLFFEDGWRAASPTNVRQFFGKLNWAGPATALGLAAGYVNNSLTGNGLQDFRLLQSDYRSIYTKPDITNNRSPFLNFSARHTFGPRLVASGNAYYRYVRTRTLNGDVNEDSLDDDADEYNGLLNTTSSKQQNFGLFGQLTWSTPRNRVIAGGGFDRSHVDFGQLTQFGYLNADRSVTGVNVFSDDTRVSLKSVTSTGSAYLADSLKIARNLTLTVSGRFNYAVIDNTDLILPGGGPGSLDGYHTFERFNPAAGLSYSPFRYLGAYASYNESSRTPTAIELGCADPTQPCKLPNALAGDPPLRQVVTRTWEAGLRGGAESNFGWSAGWFRAENRNDLLFVSSTQTGFGYFRNFGKTRRQGAEISVNSRIKRLTAGGGYTFLEATYESPETVDGSANSANLAALSGSPGVEGVIAILPGNQIPLTPRHMAKAYADLRVTSRLSIDLNAMAVGRSFARGNENNLSQPAPPYYLGAGYSPGYAVANAGARLRITSWAEAYVQANNLLDRRYYTAAQLGPAAFTTAGTFLARPLPPQNGAFPLQHATFLAPGAPRGVWGGLRIHF